MAHGLAADVLGHDLDADLHRGVAGVVDAGQEGHELADMDRLQEHDLIDAQGHDIARGIAAGTGIGDLVKQLEDGAAVDVAREVGHVGRHQHGHAELVCGQVHSLEFMRTL